MKKFCTVFPAAAVPSALLIAALLAAFTSPAHAQSNNQCDLPGEKPDVIVGDLSDKTRYGVVGDITAFAIGTTSCNLGTCWLNWFAATPEHPVIGQNMFRLKNGRFEQIGQSWLKHGFTALQGPVCSGSCMAAPDGTHLGVNCSDPYGSGLNGSQTRLGPKFEVNPYTGEYPFPATNGSQTGDAIYKRLQVHTADLDPLLNAGASYFVEGQYVTHDDAMAGNGANNASYRTLTVSGSSGVFDIALTGSTQRQKPGIQAWKDVDPFVSLTNVNPPGDGLFIVGVKVTTLAGGIYRYEYAIQNLTSYRAAQSFSVPIPDGIVITNVGFHDVDYHSGEPFDGTDWPSTIGTRTISWTTTSFDVNPNANALRWGTLYNFRFDANVPPANTSAGLSLFRPGFGGSAQVSTIGPRLCNGNGVCDSGETCGNCAADCFHQGGGTGCCGNTVCNAGENPCICAADCGSAVEHPEASCGNSIDDDCDGVTDCLDTNCCASPVCASSDTDGDHVAAACDCDDHKAAVYPGAPQLCDGINNDCDAAGWPAMPAGEQDADDDSVRVCAGDCDDADPQRFPGNPELCDGIDNDCSGSVLADEADADSDGHRLCAGDCNDGNSQVWAVPGEAPDLMLTGGALTGPTEITWSMPSSLGGTSARYDVLRSPDADDFVSGAVCVQSNGFAMTISDSDPPAAGAVSYYLVRARNDCPNGTGPLGFTSSGAPRTGRECP